MDSKFVLERFDHVPESDHCDKISSISGCSKLKLIATGSFDGTIRIWNGKNQLIRFLLLQTIEHKNILFSLFFHRMIVIHDHIPSLHFSNDSGDLIVGIGDHLYKMSHLSCK